MAFHTKGPLSTPEGTARWSNYYNESGIPVSHFDGRWRSSGGSSQTYSNYLQFFNTRKVVPSPLALTVLKSSYGGGYASIRVRLRLEEDLPASHVYHLTLWEADVVESNETHRFVERAMATKDVTVTKTGQTQGFSHTFQLRAGWDVAKLGITAFVQCTEWPNEKLIQNGVAAKLAEGIAVEATSLGRVKALYR
ncbi:MAG: hypothetical protein JSU81_01880 [Candidatus Coatesbacteria bacterium]|nr:MAG: hypothetical protein JSU81_01880 [Candidatus Coatesbacteria bacterium]